MVDLDDYLQAGGVDKSDALGFLGQQQNQLLFEFNFQPATTRIPVDNVVFGGMGGSALYAEIANSWPRLGIPFEIVRDYQLPQYVGPNTLYIASSFSGNTEEALALLSQAQEKDASIAVITAGGELLKLARANNYPVCVLDDSILQPRMSTLNSFKALITVLQGFSLTDKDTVEQLVEQADFVKAALESWKVDVPESKNLAKQLATKIYGTSPVVYSSQALFPAANKWKINFNENAKNTAWSNVVPESNHNEFIGWSVAPKDKPYSVINILSSLDSPQIQKRFSAVDKLLQGKRPESINVQAEGKNLLQQLLYILVLGDMTSAYLAILNEVDPTPVALVERLKEEINEV